MNIQEAIQFVIDEVEQPALDHPLLEQEYKYKVIRSKSVVRNVKKVGDLHRYLKRFEFLPSADKRDLYNRFKSLGLKTYEDLYTEFTAKFMNQLDDVTVLDDFIIGKDYTSWDISIYAQTYDTQSGIYLIGSEPNYQAIFIKATFENGKYPNNWIQVNEVIKYYMYSLKDVFNPSYKYNAAIINSTNTNTPIYLFVKAGTRLTLNGIYRYSSQHEETNDGSKWFVLNKLNSLSVDKVVTEKEYNHETYKQVSQAKETSKSERLNRLKDAQKKPGTISVVSTAFRRNADVIAEVLDRSRGLCEKCGKPAPFLRSDYSPYLEVHHVIPLAEGGDDTVENAEALCPNCHRAAHHAAVVTTVTAALIVENGKILIAKRKGNMGSDGLWEFPGGKIEPGETPEQCLRRVIKEELVVSIKVGRYFGESVHHYENSTIRLMAYRAKKISGEPLAKEHEQIQWVRRDELSQYQFMPTHIPLIKMIIQGG